MMCLSCRPVAYLLRLRSGAVWSEVLVIGCPHALPTFRTHIEETLAALADDGGAPVTGVVQRTVIGWG